MLCIIYPLQSGLDTLRVRLVCATSVGEYIRFSLSRGRARVMCEESLIKVFLRLGYTDILLVVIYINKYRLDCNCV